MCGQHLLFCVCNVNKSIKLLSSKEGEELKRRKSPSMCYNCWWTLQTSSILGILLQLVLPLDGASKYLELRLVSKYYITPSFKDTNQERTSDCVFHSRTERQRTWDCVFPDDKRGCCAPTTGEWAFITGTAQTYIGTLPVFWQVFPAQNVCAVFKKKCILLQALPKLALVLYPTLHRVLYMHN